ncbi:MAG TPA: hypothetical protein VMB05_11480 [Solirubrobacteraceae bacterium]|nr:hypothetical protein [Solirubrobacteraceae bacterium]
MIRDSTSTIVALGVSGALLIVSAGGSPAVSGGRLTVAHRSRAMRVSATARMHRVACDCDDVLETGEARGSLSGIVRAYVNVGTPIIFRFTISLHGGGTLAGEGSGKPKGNPAEPSFKGSMTVTHGTGRYRHAHGSGDFYGTINRSTYAATIQTTGTLSY